MNRIERITRWYVLGRDKSGHEWLASTLDIKPLAVEARDTLRRGGSKSQYVLRKVVVALRFRRATKRRKTGGKHA